MTFFLNIVDDNISDRIKKLKRLGLATELNFFAETGILSHANSTILNRKA